MSGSRKLLIISGMLLALWGMGFGLYYALFVEHQVLDKLAGSLATSFTDGAKGDLIKKRIILCVAAVLDAACLPVAALRQKEKKKATAHLTTSITSARVIELNFIWDSKSLILSLNPPFAIGLHSSHKQTAGAIP